jgi:hypothetical protein
MPCIFGGKGKVDTITPIASYHRRIFSVAETLDMDIPVDGFNNKKLA